MTIKEILHKHVIIRAETAFAPEKSEFVEQALNRTIEQLIKDINMKVVLPARCVWVGQEGNEGYTGQAGLETSHIAYHIWNKPDRAIMNSKAACLFQLDLYTCGCLCDEEIAKIVGWVNIWEIVDLEVKVFDRANTITEIKDIIISPYNELTNNIEQALEDDNDATYRVEI